ncbi:MAG: phosphatase PAP2 family protein [Clostridia bacterium]|nr:phosphatase PAP2 family protein [Clostridia bacterium]
MIQELDFCILDAIQGLRCEFLDMLCPWLTMLGSGGIIWIVLTLCLLVRKQSRTVGIMLAVGLLTGLIVGNGILKNFFARSRPCWLRPELQLLIESPKDFSFPSGHTLSSFISAFILLLTKSRLRYAALIGASVIAFTRLYLYVHFPSDILGGIVLAFIISAAVYAVFKRRNWLTRDNDIESEQPNRV